MFCHFCKLLGHDLRHCASHFSATRSEGDVEFQYGDWLKAIGGCYRSSPKRKTERDHEPNFEEENKGDNDKRQTSLVQIETATTIGSKVGNPTEKERGENENSKNHREEALQNPTIIVVEKLNKESGGGKGIEESNVRISSNTDAMLEVQHVDQRDVPMQNGPNNQKAKPTWVRLRRMDCEPKETEAGEKISALGKRVATQMLEEDSNRDDEAQPGKRGKAEAHDENSKEILARVVYRPCREQ